MKLHQLMSTTGKAHKRVGRGMASGKGKTSGRGMKGQKARGNIPMGFIGGTLPFYKKFPFRRGLGNPKVSPKMLPISLDKLTGLDKNTEVDLEKLIELKLVSERKARRAGVKLVAGTKFDLPLIIKLPVTTSAAAAIEKAGGKVVNG